MLKGLFNSSIALAAGGFVLLCASSPEDSKMKFSQIVEHVAEFSAKHRISFLPNSFTTECCANTASHAYRISLVDALDYYGATPKFGTLIR